MANLLVLLNRDGGTRLVEKQVVLSGELASQFSDLFLLNLVLSVEIVDLTSQLGVAGLQFGQCLIKIEISKPQLKI